MMCGLSFGRSTSDCSILEWCSGARDTRYQVGRMPNDRYECKCKRSPYLQTLYVLHDPALYALTKRDRDFVQVTVSALLPYSQGFCGFYGFWMLLDYITTNQRRLLGIPLVSYINDHDCSMGDPQLTEAIKDEPAHSIIMSTIEKGSTVLVTGANG